MPVIKKIKSREILDSRGFPTVEVDVILDCNTFGRASVPSGSSTGTFEACELRDGDKVRYFGKGVKNAVNFVNTEINDTIQGFEVTEQKFIDQTLIDLDNTKNKSRLGANAILGVSLAVAKASANYYKLPLYKYLGGVSNVLPTPMMNIVNGGCHANNGLDFQEFMIIPVNFTNFSSALRAGAEIFHILKQLLNKKNLSTSVGDEGGFAPNFNSNKQCLDMISQAVEKSNYSLGKDIYLGLDVASTEFYSKSKYNLAGENLILSSEKLVLYYENLIKNYPIISIEDPMSENDWSGWEEITHCIGEKCQLVGDDLFVTNIDRLKKGINKKCANSILIKLNQIGTVSETIMTINEAKDNNFNNIISHRSGETEDTFIADLAVGLSASQIKTGSLSRGERICKYNQILRIEETLEEAAQFAGINPFKRFLGK